MWKDKKIEYVIKYLVWIGLLETKIESLKVELFSKDEKIIDEILQKLWEYYQKQNILDKEFLKKLEKLNNEFDEKLEQTIDKIVAEDIINF